MSGRKRQSDKSGQPPSRERDSRGRWIAARKALIAERAKAVPDVAQKPPPVETPRIDIDRLAANVAQLIDSGRKVAVAWSHAGEDAPGAKLTRDSVRDAVATLGRAAEFWMGEPARLAGAQSAWTTQMIDLWGNTLRRLTGTGVDPLVPRGPDRRFADPQWDNPFFDFLRQAHAISAGWAHDLVARADLDPATRAKAAFYLRQIVAAASPSNFLLTNPELLHATLGSDGDNLVRGLAMLAEDIEAGGGQLRLRQSDTNALELGRDMATTPGKVVFRNELIELLQYEPTTAQVFARPVLVVPPWINKFYILDLNPQKSFVRWLVERGLTVFVISWVNPDARHADKGFDAYMHEGVLAALDAVQSATEAPEVAAIGYCVGGTMLASTLAWMAAKNDRRISSATLFAAQTDFADPGDLAVFADAATVARIDAHMAQTGFLDGATMATAFNMLRPDDLIWSYVVSNYLRGQQPAAFDLLSWNSDSTRMTRANQSYYLRECYLENNLSTGRMVLDGVTLDLGRITIPVYSLATKEDHIAPAASVYRGMQFFGGPVRYVLGGSGHIAGVVNPPVSGKYQFWSDGPAKCSFDEWRAHARETKGSWWPDWLAWLTAQAPAQVPARVPGAGPLPALGEAPGDYVRVRA